MRRAALALILIAGSACAQGDMPDRVLDGTQVTDLASYAPAPRGTPLPDRYGTETGGAGQSLEIGGTGDTLTVTRRIAEPGMATETATYRMRPAGVDYLGADGMAVLRPVAGGVLFFERAGGGSIPADLWIFYPRQR